MDELTSLKNDLGSKRNQLRAKEKEKANYLSVASDIRSVYKALADEKKAVKNYHSGVKSISDEHFDTFVGNLYMKEYKPRIKQVVSDYKKVISAIDTNMDRLNTEIARMENEAYKCDGIIGYLHSAINSLVHTIENWTN